MTPKKLNRVPRDLGFDISELPEALQKDQEFLGGLVSLVTPTIGGSDPQGLLSEILSVLLQAMDATRAMFFMTEEGGKRMRLLKSRGHSAAMIDGVLVFPRGRGLAGKIAETGRPMESADLIKEDFSLPVHREQNYRSAYGIPLFMNGKLYGALEVVWGEPDRRITEAERSFLEAAGKKIINSFEVFERLKSEEKQNELSNLLMDLRLRFDSEESYHEVLIAAAMRISRVLWTDVVLLSTTYPSEAWAARTKFSTIADVPEVVSTQLIEDIVGSGESFLFERIEDVDDLANWTQETFGIKKGFLLSNLLHDHEHDLLFVGRAEHEPSFTEEESDFLRKVATIISNSKRDREEALLRNYNSVLGEVSIILSNQDRGLIEMHNEVLSIVGQTLSVDCCMLFSASFTPVGMMQTLASTMDDTPEYISFQPIAHILGYGMRSYVALPGGDERTARWIDENFGFDQALLFSSKSASEMQGCLICGRKPGQPKFTENEINFLKRYSTIAETSEATRATQKADHDIAAALQKSLLSQVPQSPGFSIDSVYRSATTFSLVGGDFFDVFEMPGDCLGVVLGDISGKGVNAAAMTYLIKNVVSAYVFEGASDPKTIVGMLNKLLVNVNEFTDFASLIFISIHRPTGKAKYCCAGHPPAYLERAASGTCEILPEHSPIIGVIEDVEFTEGTFELKVDDVLFMYTDGVTEARSPTGNFFGEERLLKAFARNAQKDFDTLLSRMTEELRSFTHGSLQDDYAMLALRYDGMTEETL